MKHTVALSNVHAVDEFVISLESFDLAMDARMDVAVSGVDETWTNDDERSAFPEPEEGKRSPADSVSGRY